MRTPWCRRATTSLANVMSHCARFRPGSAPPSAWTNSTVAVSRDRIRQNRQVGIQDSLVSRRHRRAVVGCGKYPEHAVLRQVRLRGMPAWPGRVAGDRDGRQQCGTELRRPGQIVLALEIQCRKRSDQAGNMQYAPGLRMRSRLDRQQGQEIREEFNVLRKDAPIASGRSSRAASTRLIYLDVVAGDQSVRIGS